MGLHFAPKFALKLKSVLSENENTHQIDNQIVTKSLFLYKKMYFRRPKMPENSEVRDYRLRTSSSRKVDMFVVTRRS